VPYLVEDPQTMTFSEAQKKRQFMIGSKLVDEGMVGQFPGSVIIMGGCETLAHSFLADSFIARGASSVIGWNDLVETKNNDKAILTVLEESLVNDLEINEAIDSAMDEMVHVNNSKLQLKHYSSGADLDI